MIFSIICNVIKCISSSILSFLKNSILFSLYLKKSYLETIPIMGLGYFFDFHNELFLAFHPQPWFQFLVQSVDFLWLWWMILVVLKNKLKLLKNKQHIILQILRGKFEFIMGKSHISVAAFPIFCPRIHIGIGGFAICNKWRRKHRNLILRWDVGHWSHGGHSFVPEKTGDSTINYVM